MILFKDRRTGSEVMLKGLALTPARLGTRNLGIGAEPSQFEFGPGIGDLHKLVVDPPRLPSRQPSRFSSRFSDDDAASRARKRHKALWDDRVPHDLRHRIIDLQRRAEAMPDGMSGGERFHQDRNDLAADVVRREDLPAKLQRRLLQLVLDNAPITPLSREDRSPGSGF